MFYTNNETMRQEKTPDLAQIGEGRQQIAINRNDIPDYDPTRQYFATNIVGNCMNATTSPAMVGDGGMVICHKVDKFSFLRDWEQYRGRAVVFELAAAHPLAVDGRNMIKEFVRVDYGVFMVFQFHNPTKTCLSIGTDEFTDIAIVDKVLKQGGKNAHARK